MMSCCPSFDCKSLMFLNDIWFMYSLFLSSLNNPRIDWRYETLKKVLNIKGGIILFAKKHDRIRIKNFISQLGKGNYDVFHNPCPNRVVLTFMILAGKGARLRLNSYLSNQTDQNPFRKIFFFTKFAH